LGEHSKSVCVKVVAICQSFFFFFSILVRKMGWRKDGQAVSEREFNGVAMRC
jgi:hypothetical protein